MRPMGRQGGHDSAHGPPHLMVFDPDPARSDQLVASLEAQGYRVSRPGTPHEALQGLRRERPILLIWANGSTATESGRASLGALRTTARELGIPLLDVLETGLDPQALADRHGDADDWVFRANAAAELPVRAARVLHRRTQAEAGTETSHTAPLGLRYLPLIVHDLRTPLNVIGLSLRMIEQVLPKDSSEIAEDLRFVEENFKQIELMLTQVSDYYRLYAEATLSASAFSPARLLAEVIEERSERSGAKAVPVRLEIQKTCPPEASLDQKRAQQAIQYALANAMASSNGNSVRVTAHGGPQRWVTEFRIDQPPPDSVKPITLRPDHFERLCGIAGERRGMDLAIAARVSELFGGSARLDVDEDRGTTIVLDWPTQLAQS